MFLPCVPALSSLSDVVEWTVCIFVSASSRAGSVWCHVDEPCWCEREVRTSFSSACALESRFAVASAGCRYHPFPLPQIHTTLFFNCVLPVFVRQRPEHNGALCYKVHNDRIEKNNACESRPAAQECTGSIIKTAAPGYNPSRQMKPNTCCLMIPKSMTLKYTRTLLSSQ